MNFEKFKNAQFQRRTAKVNVPSLSAFADEGAETCEIEVQGLTGEEVATARERVKTNTALNEVIEKFAGGTVPEAVDALKEKLGLSDSLPGDAVYRLAVLEFGLVGHPFDRPDCVRMFNAHPEAFYSLTSKILELTGVGQPTLGE